MERRCAWPACNNLIVNGPSQQFFCSRNCGQKQRRKEESERNHAVMSKIRSGEFYRTHFEILEAARLQILKARPKLAVGFTCSLPVDATGSGWLTFPRLVGGKRRGFDWKWHREPFFIIEPFEIPRIPKSCEYTIHFRAWDNYNFAQPCLQIFFPGIPMGYSRIKQRDVEQ